MSTRKWPDIEGLHVVVRDLKHHHEQGGPVPPVVQYRAKIKLDGTNAAVRFREGLVEAYQSRTQDITPEADNAGFARWASSVAWPHISSPLTSGVGLIHGEWAGPGIQKRTACQSLPRKKFFVFALEYSEDIVGEDGNWKNRILVTGPEAILRRFGGWTHPDVHVLPWQSETLEVDFADPDSTQKFADKINSLVSSVEGVDPYIRENFGVEGYGEGVVLYPIVEDGFCLREYWRRLAFKAKGELHAVKKSSKPAVVDPEILSGTREFVEAFVTEARCEQGLGVVMKGAPPDMRKTGEFLAWLSKDVEKESRTELEASGLTWKNVSGEVSTAARNWYMAQCKKI